MHRVQYVFRPEEELAEAGAAEYYGGGSSGGASMHPYFTSSASAQAWWTNGMFERERLQGRVALGDEKDVELDVLPNASGMPPLHRGDS